MKLLVARVAAAVAVTATVLSVLAHTIAVGSVWASAAAAAPGWVTMRLPATVARPAVLNSIAAGSRSLAWAAGTQALSGEGRPLLLHWNGRHWVKDSVPDERRTGQMVQVSSASPGTAWALGYLGDGATLIDRWVRSGWVAAPVPADLAGQTVYSIAAGTGGGAWLWGYSDSRGQVLERWTRTGWRSIKVPYNLWGDVEDMRTAGPDSVWLDDYTNSGVYVIARYTSGVWTATPPQPWGASFITDFLPVTARSVWTTGYVCTAVEPGAGCITIEPELAHWNGSAWHMVRNLAGISLTTSISADRDGQPQWAGVSASGKNESPSYEHFDGRGWSLERAGPLIRGASSASTQVTAIPGTGAAWAIAGSQAKASGSGVTVIQYNPGP